MEINQQLNNVISRLGQAKYRKPGTLVRLSQQALVMICELAQSEFQKEPTVLEVHPPIKVIGDIHGQFFDLLRIFDISGPPPQTRYLFLGDLVDRGEQSIETVTLLFTYKILYPNCIYFIRGNHEFPEINSIHGFKNECITRYSQRLWNSFNCAFSYMPLACVIGGKIIGIHGGISPQFPYVADISNVTRPINFMNDHIIDLLASDPDPLSSDWQKNPRGASVTYGLPQVHEFLDKNNLDVLIRGHQSVENGFEFPFEPDRSTLTIYSAPVDSFSGKCSGTILSIETNLNCTFTEIKPIERRPAQIAKPFGLLDSIINPRVSLSRSLPNKKW